MVLGRMMWATGGLAVAAVLALSAPRAEAAITVEGTFGTVVESASGTIAAAKIELISGLTGYDFGIRISNTTPGPDPANVITNIEFGSYNGGPSFGTFSSSASIAQENGVDYVNGSNGLNVPGFVQSAAFSTSGYKPDNPAPTNGISNTQSTDNLVIGFSWLSSWFDGLSSNPTDRPALAFAAIGNAISSGGIALKWQSGCKVGDNGSCEGVSTVPIPAALPLLASGLSGLWFVGSRRRREKSATA